MARCFWWSFAWRSATVAAIAPGGHIEVEQPFESDSSSKAARIETPGRIVQPASWAGPAGGPTARAAESFRRMSSDENPPAADAAAAQPAPPAARSWMGRARRAIGRVSDHAQHEAHHYAREAVEEAVIDLTPLPRELRFLTGAGYAILVALLAAVLASERAGEHLPGITFHNGAEVVRAPAAVVPGAAAAFAVGWAYLLAGATLSGPWMFVPALILFTFT